jgi:hypothetical protein
MTSNSQDSPWLWFGGSHHLPPYNIFYTSLWGLRPNVFFLSWDTQMGVLKLPTLGLPQLWAFTILCVDLRLWWGLNQSFSPSQEIFKGMSHATRTQGNLFDSRLLVVGSQIANLTPDPSFGHNLSFKCSNGPCEPILDIYVSISFHWYK